MSAVGKRKYPPRLVALFIVLTLSLFGLASCGGDSTSGVQTTGVANALDDGRIAGTAADAAQGLVPDATGAPGSDAATALEQVVISTNLGDIEVLLDRASAPITVANFLGYVEAGHYDQTIFHRVIPGFMIQGGGFSADYQRNQTESPILNEASNGLSNDRYTIAMARTPLAHSATDQFFINVVDNLFLNYSGPTDSTWGYAVFGRVTDGFDVVEDIAAVTTGAAGPFATDAPVELVTIVSVRVK